MQTELETEYPLLDIHFVGVNRFGLESGNAEMTEGKSIPWLQDMDHNSDGSSDVWAGWGAGHLDLVVLDGNNELLARTNLSAHPLEDQENHDALRETLIDAAMHGQKPWHNAENPLDVDGSGAVIPLDVLIMVNRLNATGSHKLPPPVVDHSPPPYYDASGDGNSTPLDVLMVISFLNARSASAAGEGESSARPQQLSAEDAGTPVPWQDWTLAEPSTSDLSAESPTLAADGLSTETQLGEPSSDPARPSNTDHMFGADLPDWLRFDSITLDAEIDLDLLARISTV
ncbi:MAG: hypothetical protein H8E44_37830 [Planctomycetes bacterium]|nr:hypothetical protein [Planctomycetota bacterium]MBL7042023.1 hypothetical protein [Pirellulaceae bacterium]